MSKEEQTGSEPIVAEPKAVQAEPTKNVETPAIPGDQTNKAPEEVPELVKVDPKEELGKQAKEVKASKVAPEKADTPTRKERAIVKSVKSFDKALEDDGSIDFDILAREYRANPKGLESFAEKHGFDKSILEEELNLTAPEVTEEKLVIPDEIAQRIEALEAALQSKVVDNENELYADEISSRIESAGLNFDEFRTTYGSDYDAKLTELSKSLPLVEAGKYAFLEVVNNSDAGVLKEAQRRANLIVNATVLPDGTPTAAIQADKEIPMMTSTEVNALPKEKRIEYKAKYKDPITGQPKYKS